MADPSLVLTLLKKDLQIMTDSRDDYLMVLLSAARDMIEREGIRLTEAEEDTILHEMYAAYLYRSRLQPGPMPRMLRYGLNNRLLSQKAGETSG